MELAEWTRPRTALDAHRMLMLDMAIGSRTMPETFIRSNFIPKLPNNIQYQR